MGKFRYEDKKMQALQEKIARAMHKTFKNGSEVWEHDEAKGVPLVTEGSRAYWRNMAFVALEVMREEVGDK
jgi:hypothetical protein